MGSDGPQQNLLLPALNSKGQSIFRPPMMRTNSATYVSNTNCYGSTTQVSNASMANWGQFYWDEHYQDVPGVNIAIPVTVTLTQDLAADSSGYTYSMSDQFYHPINNQGYGIAEALTVSGPAACCELDSNPYKLTHNINMWFTVEFSIPFYYRSKRLKFLYFFFLGWTSDLLL